MDVKGVCLSLLAAESESEVQDIINKTPELADEGNWYPLDGRETNFNVTANQAADGGKALTELMTNMVDAILMRCAYEEGIDPKGENAPQTMYGAVDTFIKNLGGGKLTNLDSDDLFLREFAEKNLIIGITGAKSKKDGFPSYTFVDSGEGQKAEDFENTFLSLSAGHKKSIPFVQGKFNMGSSGVLCYCGRCWFKLIISRRFDKKNPWAYTLMRRRPAGKDDMPVAEYFMLDGRKIPTFQSDALYPFQTMDKNQYDKVVRETGTIVKLYDYRIGSQFMSFKGAREALNENLTETILPFRLLDFRQLPKGSSARAAAEKRGGDRAKGIDARPFYGMEFLLLRSHKEADAESEEDDTQNDEHAVAGEEKIFVGNISDPRLGDISISAIPLRRKIPGWLKSSKNRVFHTINGQVHYKQTRGYLVQTCDLAALKDRIVIIVDASNLTFSTHNEIWKVDREHIRRTIDAEKYLDKVKTTIKESESLRELQQKIAEEELEKASKTESNALFQKLLDEDRNIEDLFTGKIPTIRLPFSSGRGRDGKKPDEWKGKYSPTYVKLKEQPNAEIHIPINKARPIASSTDAENGYLNRDDNQGRVVIDASVRDKFVIRKHLLNGRLVLYFELVEGVVKVGDEFQFTIGLEDDAMPQPVTTEKLTIKIAPKEAVNPRRKRPPTPPRPDPDSDDAQKGKKNEGAPVLGLPRCILLNKDGRPIEGYETEIWPEGFDEHDGGIVEDLGEESIYKINYDNVYHLRYRLQQKGDINRDVVTEKYILGMRILMMGYEQALRIAQSKIHESQDGNYEDGDISDFADDFRRMAARGAASTVLALAESLPRMVNPASISEDVE